MVKRVKPKRKGKEQTLFRQHNRLESAELPSLELSVVEAADSFVTKTVQLRCSGWSVEEAAEGINFLVRKLKEVRK